MHNTKSMAHWFICNSNSRHSDYQNKMHKFWNCIRWMVIFVCLPHSTWGQRRRRRKPQLTPGKLTVDIYLCVVRCTPLMDTACKYRHCVLCYIHRWSLKTFTTAPVRYIYIVKCTFGGRQTFTTGWRTKPHRLTQH